MSFGVDELASLLAATVLEYSIVTTFFVIYSVAGVSGVSAAIVEWHTCEKQCEFACTVF
jgi:hypothetical protein